MHYADRKRLTYREGNPNVVQLNRYKNFIDIFERAKKEKRNVMFIKYYLPIIIFGFSLLASFAGSYLGTLFVPVHQARVLYQITVHGEPFQVYEDMKTGQYLYYNEKTKSISIIKNKP